MVLSSDSTQREDADSEDFASCVSRHGGVGRETPLLQSKFLGLSHQLEERVLRTSCNFENPSLRVVFTHHFLTLRSNFVVSDTSIQVIAPYIETLSRLGAIPRCNPTTLTTRNLDRLKKSFEEDIATDLSALDSTLCRIQLEILFILYRSLELFELQSSSVALKFLSGGCQILEVDFFSSPLHLSCVNNRFDFEIIT